MKSIYSDGEYLQKNPTWHMEDSDWKAKYILQILGDSGLAPKRIAEVGCGAGGILRALHDQLPSDVQFHGYDISPQAVELARSESNHERLDFRLKNILEEEETFDVILCIDVFEHVEDYYSFLRTLKTKAGYIVFHIPLDMSTVGVLRGHVMQSRKAVGHIHYFSPETAIATLEDTGYDIIDSFFINSGDKTKKKHSLKGLILDLARKATHAISPMASIRHLGGSSLMVLAKTSTEDS